MQMLALLSRERSERGRGAGGEADRKVRWYLNSNNKTLTVFIRKDLFSINQICPVLIEPSNYFHGILRAWLLRGSLHNQLSLTHRTE